MSLSLAFWAFSGTSSADAEEAYWSSVREKEVMDVVSWPVCVRLGSVFGRVVGAMSGEVWDVVPWSAASVVGDSANASRSFRMAFDWRNAELKMDDAC